MVRRLCRLSYYDRVKESLPDELHCLVPNTPALNPDYILETLNGSSGALRDLQAFMKEKKPAGEVMEWLKTSGKLDALGRAGAAKALTVAALQHGQKCITHHNVLLKRYESALVELTRSDAEAGEDGCADVMVAAAAGVWAGAHPPTWPSPQSPGCSSSASSRRTTSPRGSKSPSTTKPRRGPTRTARHAASRGEPRTPGTSRASPWKQSRRIARTASGERIR